MPRRSSQGAFAALGLAACIMAMAVSGCTVNASPERDTAVRSQELTAGEFPERTPPPPKAPPPPMLRDPKTSVYSYLLWISYAYRVLDSDVASMTFGPSEEVRVNSYVELNRQESRAIDQRLLDFDVRSARTRGDTATVGATESWRYRYIDAKTGAYRAGTYDVTYETTYTVIRTAGGIWVVEAVEAEPRGSEPR